MKHAGCLAVSALLLFAAAPPGHADGRFDQKLPPDRQVVHVLNRLTFGPRPGDVDLEFVFSRGLQPLLVGVLVLGIGLSLGGPTGYAINPARDLGPRIAHAILPIPGKGNSDWGYAWIPVIAPIVGGIAGAGLYALVGF